MDPIPTENFERYTKTKHHQWHCIIFTLLQAWENIKLILLMERNTSHLERSVILFPSLRKSTLIISSVIAVTSLQKKKNRSNFVEKIAINFLHNPASISSVLNWYNCFVICSLFVGFPRGSTDSVQLVTMFTALSCCLSTITHCWWLQVMGNHFNRIRYKCRCYFIVYMA